MNRTFNYPLLILRLTSLVGVVILLALLTCFLTAALTPGGTVSAFTTNSLETRDVWVLDMSRMVSKHLRVSGHADNLPVWSAEERRIVYYPRKP